LLFAWGTPQDGAPGNAAPVNGGGFSLGFFTWAEGLRVNVPELDRHHKELIEMINALHDAVQAAEPPPQLRELVDRFRKYADYHFRAEERYMRRRKHTGYEAHKRQHQEFALSMETWYERVSQGDARAAQEALAFLKDWFLDHVQTVDQAYSPRPNQL
jgi:hemerythrin-like metal-binding protein